jgi:hypothetical protein
METPMNISREPHPKADQPETAVPSPVALLLSDDYFRGEIDIPPRGKHRHRPLPDFDP